ncbi:MAG: TetR/AcrR family transcriptional regulator [Alphaproteobacteria bacterium]|nr:TetR/AcrR family transcriptional regulator [Alphaproteobacteria bacterium]
MPALVKPTVRRERRKQERPGELLQAALELFVEKGFAATRVEEVTVRAGVSKGTLFLYYDSKEELFKAVIQAHLGEHFIAWDQEFGAFEGSTAEMLRYGIGSWWERIGSTLAGGLTKLVMSESKNFPDVAAYYRAQVMQPGQVLLQRILQRGIDQGEFRAMDAQTASLSLISAMVFLLMWRHSMSGCTPGADFDPKAFLDTHLETLLCGWARTASKRTKERHEDR